MDIISPYARIWIDIRTECVKLFGTDNVFDYLPGKDTKYPFVFVGEQYKQNDRVHKDHLNGLTQVTVHFWHNDHRKRGSLLSMMYDLEEIIQQKYKSNLVGVNTEILSDNSTGKILMHGTFEVNIKF